MTLRTYHALRGGLLCLIALWVFGLCWLAILHGDSAIGTRSPLAQHRVTARHASSLQVPQAMQAASASWRRHPPAAAGG